MSSARMRLEMFVLHAVARASLRVRSPLRAKRIVDRVGGALRPLSTDDAAQAFRWLEGSGTCLTRALAIASRLRGAEVVVMAVPSRVARPVDAPLASSSDAPLVAHAWVEHGRARIGDGGAERDMEIARLR